MGPREFIKTINDYQEGIGTLSALLTEEKEPERRTDPEFLMHLGERLYAHSRFVDADQRLQAALMSDPSNATGLVPDAMYQRVLVARKMEKYDNGLAICRELGQEYPESDKADDAAAYIAYFYKVMGRPDDAIAACEEYLKKWPDGDDADWATNQIKELKASKKKGG